MRKTTLRLTAGMALIVLVASAATAQPATAAPKPSPPALSGAKAAPTQAATPSSASLQQAKSAGITITGKYVPSRLYGREMSQLLITIKPESPVEGAKLKLQPTGGFTVTPSAIDLPPLRGGRVTVAANVGRGTAPQTLKEGAIVATLEVGGKVLETEVLTFDATAGITVWAYLLIGSLGIIVGYVVRMWAKALNEVEPPQKLALAADPKPEDLHKFVLEHYYAVDFLVTLAIGFIVLASLAKDGRAPEGSVFWSGAFVSGVALGLLTNSELITRVKGGKG